MVITVRINRAKGTHLAFRMSEYVRELVEKHGIPMDKLAVDIGATFDEIQLLMKSDMFEAKDVQNWAYSEAWFPAESGRNKDMNNYPFDYVLKYFVRGQIWKLLLPYRKSQKEWTKLL